MASNTFVKVSIFGNDYRVRGAADAEYILRIAEYVDQTMRAISAAGRHVSTTRIAILTAFNIADELHQLRQSKPSSGETEDRAARLLKLLDAEVMGDESADADD